MHIKVENLTPYTIDIAKNGEDIDIRFSAGKTIADCARCEETIDTIYNGISITRPFFSNVRNLPEPKVDTYYIVSEDVAAACPRNDLIVPTIILEKDEKRKRITCKTFSVCNSIGRVADLY